MNVSITPPVFVGSPSTTTHVDIRVTGTEDAGVGVHQVPFFIEVFGPSSEFLPGQVTYEIVVPSCFVFTRRELMITNTSVVDDAVRTAGVDFSGNCNQGGVWTFGHLLRNAAPTPGDAPAMVSQLVCQC
jgi:hypothetical protein